MNRVKRHGGVVVRNEESGRHLDFLGADASHNGGILFFHDPPNTSEVLEEAYHFDQMERGDYSDLPADEMILRREIDAQKYLLSVTERYGIPDSEVKLTKKNLAGYLRDLEEYLARREGR